MFFFKRIWVDIQETPNSNNAKELQLQPFSKLDKWTQDSRYRSSLVNPSRLMKQLWQFFGMLWNLFKDGSRCLGEMIQVDKYMYIYICIWCVFFQNGWLNWYMMMYGSIFPRNMSPRKSPVKPVFFPAKRWWFGTGQENRPGARSGMGNLGFGGNDRNLMMHEKLISVKQSRWWYRHIFVWYYSRGRIGKESIWGVCCFNELKPKPVTLHDGKLTLDAGNDGETSDIFVVW